MSCQRTQGNKLCFAATAIDYAGRWIAAAFLPYGEQQQQHCCLNNNDDNDDDDEQLTDSDEEEEEEEARKKLQRLAARQNDQQQHVLHLESTESLLYNAIKMFAKEVIAVASKANFKIGKLTVRDTLSALNGSGLAAFADVGIKYVFLEGTSCAPERLFSVTNRCFQALRSNLAPEAGTNQTIVGLASRNPHLKDAFAMSFA
jgi:hypothetical protein